MPMSAERWKVITPSEYPWEREAFDFLRERLPDHEPYRAWLNFDFVADDGGVYQVDALIVTPKGFYLVEVKSRPGVITGDAHSWTWTQGGQRTTRDNPLIATDRKAKRLKSLLARQRPLRKERVPFLQPVIFCSAPDNELRLEPNAAHWVFNRDLVATAARPERAGIVAALTRWTPGAADDPGNHRIDRPLAKAITRAVDEAGVRPSQSAQRLGDYRLGAPLGEGPGYQDFVAEHVSLAGVTRRARLYPVALAATEAERTVLTRAAQREFRILEGIDHRGILRVIEYKQHERGPALLFEHDAKAQRLDHFLRDRGAQLTVDQRIDLLRQLAEALRYAHEKKLTHRALSPSSVLVSAADSARPRPRIFNWQTGERAAGSKTALPGVSGTAHPDQLVENAALVYLAPEVTAGAELIGEYADVFSLGAIAFHLFTGKPPAPTVLERDAVLRERHGLRPSAVADGVPETLDELVHASTNPEVTGRLDAVDDFLRCLDDVEEELTAPAPERIADPPSAGPGDRLQGGFEVVRRLGTGSTAVALLVRRDEREQVLKIALDTAHNERMRAEAAVLRKLRHQYVVALDDVMEIGGRVGLLMAVAGESTLAQRLRAEGRLGLELLRRFGEDLLQAVSWLEQQGIPHRDIKPDNIGVAKVGRGDNLHLVLFDFSLSRVAPENIRAGTRPYLDPFLSLRTPPRWDLHAERFAAAMTLYEMATGTLPRWGDGQSDPALLDCEATLDTDLFDPELREGLAAFFATALRRDARQRFDTCEDMLRAWRRAFEAERPAAAAEARPDDRAARAAALAAVAPEHQVALLSLSTRALNALERLHIVTVADLLRFPVADLYRLRGVGNTTRKELGEVVLALHQRFPGIAPARRGRARRAQPAEVAAAEGGAPSVDALFDTLFPTSERDGNAIVAVLCAARRGVEGMPAALAASLWPSQTDVARALGLTPARVHQALAGARQRWAKLPAMTRLRHDIVALLDAAAGVMTPSELAAALLGLRGSARIEPRRGEQALAVVRAACETERGTDEPRLVVRRSQTRLLVARDDELIDYAERLGAAADRTAAAEPLLPPGRVIELLRQVDAPEGRAPADARLVAVAAAASSTAAVSSRLELYPRGMDAARAIRLAAGALLGARELTVEQIRERVRGRYPAAADLPERPALDGLVRDAGPDLQWSAEVRRYVSRSQGDTRSSTSLARQRTASGEPPETAEVANARAFEQRLRHAARPGAFLALTVAPRNMALAAGELRRRFAAHAVSVDAVLLRHMRAEAERLGASWDTVLRADAAPADSADGRRLRQLVHRALPAAERELLAGDGTVLLAHPGLLARYDRLDVLEHLKAGAGRPGAPAAVWVLIAAGAQSPLPVIDGHAVPVITPAEWTRIPDAWLANVHRAGSAELSADGADGRR
jgi:serine/threonine protein kinase